MSFFKNLAFLIQAAIVVAAVLLFSFFDPFGMFGSTKTKLENTTVSVESIRNIGELITAEYYGEVLSSFKEAYIEKLSAQMGHLKDYCKRHRWHWLLHSTDEDISDTLFDAWLAMSPDTYHTGGQG